MRLKERPLSATIMAISAIAFLVGGIGMARTIARFNKEELQPRAYFTPVAATAFAFGENQVEFTEEFSESGQRFVVVTFGDETIRLRETIPGELDYLPDLRRYEDWLRVYRFALVKGMSGVEAMRAIERDELDDRLVIVVRTPPPGTDHRTWGEVWSDGWMFDLYELKESGEIVHERLAYPSKRKGDEPPKEGELQEGTWQFDAAMTSIPPVARPKPQFNNDASLLFSWEFALAGVAGIVFALSTAFFFAPKRVEE